MRVGIRRMRCAVGVGLVLSLSAGSISAAVAAEGPRAVEGAVREPGPLAEAPPVAIAPEVPTGDFSSKQVEPVSAPAVVDQGPVAAPAPAPVDAKPSPVPVGELVGARDAFTRVVENEDGSRTAWVSQVPQHYRVADRSWQPIDTTVTAIDGGRVLRSGANSWNAEFGPLGEGGVRVDQVDGSSFSFEPEKAARVLPVKASDAPNAVIYPEVWPGVDLRYEVTPTGVKEDVIVKRPGTDATFSFVVTGLDLRPEPGDRFGVLQAAGSAVRVVGPETQDAAGRPVEAEARSTQRAEALAPTSDGLARSRVVVGVDESWLASRKAAGFPVVIDPTVDLGASQWAAYRNNGYSCQCGVRFGNSRDGGDSYWRSVLHFPFTQLDNTTVTSARVQFTSRTAGTGNPVSTGLWWASAWSYTGVHSGPYGSSTLWNDGEIDVTGLYQQWVSTDNYYGSVLVSGGETPGAYTYKQYSNVFLRVDYNAPSGVAQPVSPPSPGNGMVASSASPTLNAVASNPDGPYDQYYFRVAKGADAESNVVFNSDWLANGVQSVQVPASVLEPGVTYYWHAYTYDGYQQTNPNWTWSFKANALPPTPPKSSASPADGAVVVTTTPALAVSSIADPESSTPLQYRFTVATGPNGVSGSVIDSGWLATPSFTVPAGSLLDGGTYWWTVRTKDSAGLEQQATWSVKLVVNQRLGVQPASPYETAGPVSVNLATGNMVVSAATKALAAVGGQAGLSLVYNSQASPRAGLVGAYTNGLRPDYTVPTGAEPALVRLEPQVNFKWGSGSPFQSVDPDLFKAVFTGYVSVPVSGQYQFGAIHDDGVRIRIGTTTVLDDWVPQSAQNAPEWGSAVSLNAGVPTPITVEFFDSGGAAELSLWVKAPGTTPPLDQVIVPASWLTPNPAPLPGGWSLSAPSSSGGYTGARVDTSSVTVFDTSGASHRWEWNGTAWAPPPGELGSLTRATDGSLTLLDASGATYVFDPAGQVVKVTGPIDDLHPAALRNEWGSPLGQLHAVLDPVSGRRMLLQYGGNTNTTPGAPTCPTSAPAGFETAPPARLCAVGHWDGTETTFFYNAGQLARLVEAGGATTDFGYAAGVLSEIRDAFSYDLLAVGVPGAAAATAKTDVAYTNGKATSVQRPAPATGAARPTTTIRYVDATSTEVDLSGFSPPTGFAKRVTFDPQHRTLSSTDAAGLTTSYVWDPADRLRSTTDPTGRQSTTSYDPVTGWATAAYGPAPSTCFENNPASSTYLTPLGTCTVPSRTTTYDGGLAGSLGAAWRANTTLAGAPATHTTQTLPATWPSSGPGAGLGTGSWSGVLTGTIDLPATGSWKLEGLPDTDGGARVYVDDQLVHDTWRGYRDAVLKDQPDTYWRLGESSGSTAADETAPANPGTYSATTLGVAGALSGDTNTAAQLNGTSSKVTSTDAAPNDSFTLEAWVNPTATHEIDPQAPTGTGGVGGQRYLFWPDQKGTEAGIGLSVGTNGVTVYEHGDGHMPPVLVAPVAISGWTHVAVVYRDRTPTLFVNGTQVATGTTSTRPKVHAPTILGGGPYGYYQGSVDEVAIYPRPLDPAQLAGHYLAGKPAAPRALDLPAGKHRLRVDYVNRSGPGSLELRWTPPGQAAAAIPSSALSPAYGLATSTTGPTGTVTTTSYGSRPELGLAHQITVDPAGLALTSGATFETDGYYRQRTRTLPAGNAWTYDYYGDTEQRDNPCTPAADPASQGGMQKTRTGPDPDGTGPGQARVDEQVLDVAGRVVATRTGSEDWTCRTYDPRGRLTTITYPAFGGSPARTVTYDHAVNGNPTVTQVADSAGPITTEVDLLGRTVAYTDVWGKQTLTGYDPAGRVATVSGIGGTRTLGYDPAGRLDTLRLDGELLADASYDTQGLLDGVTYPSGTGNAGNGTALTQLLRDASGQLTGQTWTLTNTTVTDTVSRDVAGRIVDRAVDGTDPNPTGANYQYDPAGRLIGAVVPGHTYTYAFASSGGCGPAASAGRNANRTSVTDNGVTRSFCYDHADKLTAVTPAGDYTQLGYDGHGNATQVGVETRSYDATDRHLGTSAGAGSVTYIRDATDRIIGRTQGTTTIRYSHSTPGDAATATLDDTGALLETTLSLPGGVLLTRRANGQVWSYPDLGGSIIAIADQAGAKQGDTLQWGPYGETLTAVPDNSQGSFDHGWLGQHQRPLEHATGLIPTIEMGARQYDPTLGRFLEVDPIEGGSCNPYDYACADPINNRDLTGTRLCVDINCKVTVVGPRPSGSTMRTAYGQVATRYSAPSGGRSPSGGGGGSWGGGSSGGGLLSTLGGLVKAGAAHVDLSVGLCLGGCFAIGTQGGTVYVQEGLGCCFAGGANLGITSREYSQRACASVGGGVSTPWGPGAFGNMGVYDESTAARGPVGPSGDVEVGASFGPGVGAYQVQNHDILGTRYC